MADGIAQPVVGAARSQVDAHDTRQTGQHRLDELCVAGEISADEIGDRAATAEGAHGQLPAPQRRQSHASVDGLAARARAHHVRIAVRHHDDVARGQRRYLTSQMHVCRTFDEVSGTR